MCLALSRRCHCDRRSCSVCVTNTLLMQTHTRKEDDCKRIVLYMLRMRTRRGVCVLCAGATGEVNCCVCCTDY